MWGLYWGSVLVQPGCGLDEPLKTTRQSLYSRSPFPGHWGRPGLLAAPLLRTPVQLDAGTPPELGTKEGCPRIEVSFIT